MIEEALSTFTFDPALGAELHVFVTIKGFNQLAIVQKIMERKGEKSLGLTANDNASQRRYSTGKTSTAGNRMAMPPGMWSTVF